MLNLNKIKTLSIGIAIGVSISTLTPTFATVQQYILTRITYPIVVSGEKYANDELPVLNLNGSTYIPLRAVGDILNAKVEWNEELRRVEIGGLDKIETIRYNNNDNINLNYKEEIKMENEVIVTKNENGKFNIKYSENIRDIVSNEISSHIELDEIDELYLNDDLYYRHNVISNLLYTKGYNLIYIGKDNIHIEKNESETYNIDNENKVYTLTQNDTKLINNRLFINHGVLSKIP
jgi:hypothetical protein